MRRWISFMVVLAMFAPSAASAAEAAMATWLSPQPGQIVSGGKVEVAIGYNTQSQLKVTSIELYVDGQFLTRKVLGTPQSRGVCSFYWDTTLVEQGTHDLVVKVFAGDRMISKIYGTGTVGPNGSGKGLIDVRPPVVTFANIKAGDVLKGTSTIKMNAADDSGESPMVSLLVDDVLKLLKNTPPYSYDLDTTTYTDGEHSLKTYAYDGAGNRSDPSVVKVEFRNGAEKPVVTTLSVNHESAPDVPEAKLSTVIPPSVAASAKHDVKASARAEARVDVSSSAVAPVVAVAKANPTLDANLKPISIPASPDLKPVRIAPEHDGRIAAAAEPKISAESVAAKPAPAALSAQPVRMASSAGVGDVRAEVMKPAPVGSPATAEPIVIDVPRSSGVQSSSASKLPEVKHSPVAAPKPVTVVQSALPGVTDAVPAAESQQAASVSSPKQTGVTRMAMAPAPSELKSTTQTLLSHASPSAAVPKVVDEPLASSVSSVPVERRELALKTHNAAPATASGAIAAEPIEVAPGKLSTADIKRVQVAMAPDMRSVTERTCPSPAISCPPLVAKPSKAKLEKASVPASGKVKARDFFEKMGGVLFWDPSTRTVTACVAGMVLEMRIGSKIANVNGRQFQMACAPSLVNDRTVFEAGTYSQACSLLDSLQTVGKAELR